VRLLLDTHALIWWFLDDTRLPRRVAAWLDEPESVVFVSAASAWELATNIAVEDCRRQRTLPRPCRT
jgi:PIN domain nuclease of toxin-antitoxin system